MQPYPTPEPGFAVLLVCTGNICRSPLAERLGRAYLDDALGADSGWVQLYSAGTRAVVGSEMDPSSAHVLCRLGGEPAGFRAQQLTDRLVARADLTLTMTREHRREVLRLAPRAMSRTFTLIEAADLLDIVAPEEVPAAGTPVERARDLVRRMAAARSRRSGGSMDDVPDPIGQSADLHAQVGNTVADALIPVLSQVAAALEDDAVGLSAGPGRSSSSGWSPVR